MLTKLSSPPNNLSRALCSAFRFVALIVLLTSCASGDFAVYQNFMQPRLDAGERQDSDLRRDAGYRPMDALFFFDILPGMDVLSVRDDGYFTEVLALALGLDSIVYSQHTTNTHTDSHTFANEYERRLDAAHMVNVVELSESIVDVELEDQSLDFILLHLNLHDILIDYGEERTASLFVKFHNWLKPGGTVGVIDHVGRSPDAATKLHRLDVASGLPLLWGLPGFRVVQSSVLRNPKDDGLISSQDVSIAGSTDRLMLKLIKRSY